MNGGPTLAPNAVCSIETCTRPAVRLVQMPVDAATADKDVVALAERLNRLGVPMCELCAQRWTP